ncbi:UNVERIFIED_ORG: helix-turn-helix protein [Idiomarina abyssalis]|uniref:Predicted DNA-binding protein, possible transcriptional regulator n=1 Tax=Idiomarina loihiensis (strain ATCC BAA-735 / DSM 15497 / L2-TR) TaxID=283942 RepID=Q5R0U2_IDILO|nr:MULTISPECIES: helix-turn-helix transcriptional regulator [Idiomarina]AAV82443.1 Predicted DNA-binding protein, possible transcriptional regulator [Idiomarina loihiensis L2TR]TDO53880.1 helix-turn-helix protein [Idiomarina sp. 017G]
MSKLERKRHELATFLKSRRERLSPTQVGLPCGGRRRTPGLRREEVAALSGVGLTWYTWLEQGRDISASSSFLDNLARALKLDAAERRHLFLLAHGRLPPEPGKTFCEVPPLILRLMRDLSPHAAYVLNLRWDVLAFNKQADLLFGFNRHPPGQRNLLWMLFTDTVLRERLVDWDSQAVQMLSSFRRDYAHATQEADIQALVTNLQKASPDFSQWWNRHDVDAPCQGVRDMKIENETVSFEHTSMTVDADRHLRLVVYARGSAQGIAINDQFSATS